MQCPFCSAHNTSQAAECAGCGRSLIRIISVEAPHALSPGTNLQNGAYIVREALGQGGFGLTYFGGDIHLRRYVAIKEFFPSGCARSGTRVEGYGDLSGQEFRAARDKFLEEAQALARFHHPNIVAVYNCFEENGTAYMVMEYLQGKTLGQLLEERGALPEREAVNYIDRVGEALVAIHGANLVHRDITPANVIIGDDGRVVLFDFGLTRQVASAVGKGTRQLSGTAPFGTSGYAPPEQYLQRPQLGAFTDIYALAAMLYHCLTGEVPMQAFDRAMGAALVPPHALHPAVSPGLSEAVMWGMDIKAEQRPQTVRDFLNAVGVALRADGAPAKQGFRIRRRNNPAPLPDAPFDALFQNGAAPTAPAPARPPRPARQMSPRLHHIRRYALDRAIILGSIGVVAGYIAQYHTHHSWWYVLLSIVVFGAVGILAGAVLGLVLGMSEAL